MLSWRKESSVVECMFCYVTGISLYFLNFIWDHVYESFKQNLDVINYKFREWKYLVLVIALYDNFSLNFYEILHSRSNNVESRAHTTRFLSANFSRPIYIGHYQIAFILSDSNW